MSVIALTGLTHVIFMELQVLKMKDLQDFLEKLSISEKRHPESETLEVLFDAVIGLLQNANSDISEEVVKKTSKKKEQDATE